MLNSAKSYKLVGGKFVERTPEELDQLNQLKAEQAAREPVSRLPRQKEFYVQTNVLQITKLIQLKPICWPLFSILQLEDFRHHGKHFILPIQLLGAIRGMSPRNLRRALNQLEKHDLIRIARRPSGAPIVTLVR